MFYQVASKQLHARFQAPLGLAFNINHGLIEIVFQAPATRRDWTEALASGSPAFSRPSRD